MQAPWETTEGEVSVGDPISVLVLRAPYLSSEDRKGHDCFLGARFPKSFGQWVARIKEGIGSPYKVNADVVRDALYLGLCIIYLRGQHSNDWKIMARLTDVRAKLSLRVEIVERSREIGHLAALLFQAGDREAAVSEIQRYLEILPSMVPKDAQLAEHSLEDSLLADHCKELLDAIKIPKE